MCFVSFQSLTFFQRAGHESLIISRAFEGDTASPLCLKPLYPLQEHTYTVLKFDGQIPENDAICVAEDTFSFRPMIFTVSMLNFGGFRV